LDAFDLEKRLLEGQSKNWASEAAKATQECATLLGHQNQKQKIRRINQMGEENFQLKKVRYPAISLVCDHLELPNKFFLLK